LFDVIKRFFANLRNIFKIPELRRKVLVTLALILVYRIGRHIPVPGVNADALTSFFHTWFQKSNWQGDDLQNRKTLIP
jgi:preprotein translocase subunit SecY